MITEALEQRRTGAANDSNKQRKAQMVTFEAALAVVAGGRLDPSRADDSVWH